MKIYKDIDNSNWNSEELEIRLQNYPQGIKSRINNYGSLIKRQQRLVALSLLEVALSELKKPLFELEMLQYPLYGKPFLKEGIDFSISYSQDIVVLGIIENGIIGLDVEKIIGIDYLEYSEYFTVKEWNYLLNSKHKGKAFYYLWTRKEALVKALGTGLFQSFNSFEVLENQILFSNTQFYLKTVWFEGYCLSVASNRNVPIT